MKLFEGQKRAVKELFNAYLNRKSEKIIELKAPTGSGKTFIVANMIDKIMSINENCIFVIGTLSSSELPIQFATKLEEYSEYLNNHIDPTILYSPSKNTKKIAIPKSIPLEKHGVIIFGTSTFGKDRIYTITGEVDEFINQIRNYEIELIYIRDEAHIGTKRRTKDREEIKDEQKFSDAASFVINMTATPNGEYEQIIIKEQELETIDKSLLKIESKYNPFIEEESIDSLQLLDIALDNFRKIQNKYPSDINPAALIQVSSRNKLDKNEFKEFMKNIKRKIENHNLTWVVYFGDEKDSNIKMNKISLNEISKNNSIIDVIIFKVGPATGWDIPRANMLIQLREVHSETLNIQTIGRIKRNPRKNLIKEKELMSYYVYSNYQEKTREMFKYKLTNEYLESNKTIPIIKTHFFEDIRKENIEKIKIKLIEKFNNRIAELDGEIEKLFQGKKFVVIKESIYFNHDDKKQNHIIDNKIENLLKLKIINNQLINEEGRKGIYFRELARFLSTKSKYDFTEDQFIFVLFKKYKEEVYEIYSKIIEVNNEYEYYINQDKLRNSYSIWMNKGVDSKGNTVSFEKVKEIFPYRNTIKSMEFKQVLDSNPETYFMKYVVNHIFLNKEYTFFTKNHSIGSNVFMEYVREGNISKSYIDFIIKKNDKYLFIEIKGEDDYSKTKTEALLNSYKDYYKKIKNLNKSMSFMLIKINKKTTQKGFRKLDGKKLKHVIYYYNNENREILTNSLTIDEILEQIENTFN